MAPRLKRPAHRTNVRQAPALSTDPQATVGRGRDRVDAILAEAEGPDTLDAFALEHVEPARRRRKPDAVRAIDVDRSAAFGRHALGARVRGEGGVVKTLDPRAASQPQVPLPVLEDRCHSAFAVAGHLLYGSSRIDSQRARVRPHPDVQVPVSKESERLHAAKRF